MGETNYLAIPSLCKDTRGLGLFLAIMQRVLTKDIGSGDSFLAISCYNASINILVVNLSELLLPPPGGNSPQPPQPRCRAATRTVDAAATAGGL